MAAPIDPLAGELTGPSVPLVEGLSVRPPFGTMDYAVSGSGDTRSLTIDYLRVDMSAEGETVSAELEDGCWTIVEGYRYSIFNGQK